MTNAQIRRDAMRILAAQCSVSFGITEKDPEWLQVVAVSEDIVSVNR